MTWLIITGIIHMLVEGETPTPGCIQAHSQRDQQLCLLHPIVLSNHIS